jgi:hypothetical protein
MVLTLMYEGCQLLVPRRSDNSRFSTDLSYRFEYNVCECPSVADDTGKSAWEVEGAVVLVIAEPYVHPKPCCCVVWLSDVSIDKLLPLLIGGCWLGW